jgi:hypothetical protein
MASLVELRRDFHQQLYTKIIRVSTPKKKMVEYPNFADADSTNSIQIAWEVMKHLGYQPESLGRDSVDAGALFQKVTLHFLELAFGQLSHLRPGNWTYSVSANISEFDQYAHLERLLTLVKRAKAEGGEIGTELELVLGRDYIVKPDIVVGRHPVTDAEINRDQEIIGTSDSVAQHTPLRVVNHPKKPKLILHASVSCKWTVRSDRAQNSRTEALNLIRNRKGSTPHIVAVTMEPMPTRIQSLAFGVGDLDCIYHAALPELEAALKTKPAEGAKDTLADQREALQSLIASRRLRDISDLPLDLAV